MARPRKYQYPTTGFYRRLYGIWERMKARCYTVSCKDYQNYGGRGITLCREWLSYDNFCKWALSNGYRDDLTIERKDVNGNYEPSNCRWATKKEQSRNTRVNHLVNGVSLAEYAEMCGIKYSTIRSRLRYGYDATELSNPIRRAITVEGMRLDEIGAKYNIPVTTLKSRYYAGIDTIDEIIKPRKHTGRKKRSLI